MAAVQQEMGVVIKLNDQFSSGLKDIQKETSNTFDEKKPGSFLSGIKASSVALAGMAVGGIAAVGAGLTVAFNKAREFEQSMANVKAITGATGEDFESLKKLAQDMGATTAHSATAAAEGIQFLGMAGLDTNQIMDALPGTLSLASAAGMELGAAADISTNILSGLGLEVTERGGVVDKLAQTARSANTDVNQLGEGFKMVAPSAASAGMSFDDTVVSLGLLANAAMSGSIGGSSLNSALRAMINPSKEAEREAKKLGLTFVDASGNLLPMENILSQLEENSVSTKQSFQIFGTEGARAINALRNQGTAAFRAFDRKVKESGGVAEDMAKNRLGSFDGAVKMLKSAFDGFAIVIGEQFLPIATAIVTDFLTPAINKTNAFVEAVGGFGQMWKDVGTMIVSFKNTALNILSELFNNASFAEEFLGNIGSIFSAAGGAIMTFAFGSKQMSGIGGAVGIIIELGKIIWEPLKQGFLAIWDFIKKPLVAGINWITETFTGGLNSIISEWNKIGDKFGLAIDLIDFTPLTVEPAKTFQERWTEGTDSVKKSWSTVEGLAKDIGDNIGADIDNVTAAMKETADSAAHLVDEGMEKVTTKWSGHTDKMANEAEQKGKAIGEPLGDGINDEMDKAAANSSRSFLSTFGSAMTDPKSGPAKLLSQGLAEGIRTGDFQSAIAGVTAGMASMIGGPIAGALTERLIGAVLGSGPSAAQRAEGAFGDILRGFEMAGGDIRKTGGLPGQMKGVFTKKGKISKEGGIQGGINKAFQKVIIKLTKMGMSEEDARLVLWSMGSLRWDEDKQFDDDVYQRANVILREALIREEERDIRLQRQQMGFERGITSEAERRLSGKSSSAMDQRDMFAAQHGYSGMVSQPTLFLAGEAGPEMVDITPTGRMSGGFQGSGGQNFHFNFAVNTIDEQGVKAFIEEDARPFIVQMLQRESTRGASVMYQSGITTDPSV